MCLKDLSVWLFITEEAPKYSDYNVFLKRNINTSYKLTAPVEDKTT